MLKIRNIQRTADLWQINDCREDMQMGEERGFRKSFVILSVCYVIAGIILVFWPDISMDLFCSALGIGMLEILGITHIIIFTLPRIT